MRKQDVDLSAFVESEKELEVFPGRFERRHFIRGSLATAISLVVAGTLSKTVLAQASTTTTALSGSDKLAWDEFLKQSVPVAQQLIANPAFSVDEYLYRIGSLATRLKELPDSALGSYKTVEPRVWFGPSFRGTPFFIIQWRMEPGANLPPHNHPNASVCTLGFEGEVGLRNFEILGEVPDYDSKKTFRVRETHSQTLARGRISTLSPARDNIHWFQVGKEGGRGIDINTLHGKMGPFSFMEIAKAPEDSEKRIFEAAWIEKGRPPAASTP